MSAKRNWQSQGWAFYDTPEEAMEEAVAAAHHAPVETLPTIFQTTAGKFTFGLTGWEIFKAVTLGWDMIILFRKGWRESLCGEVVDTLNNSV